MNRAIAVTYIRPVIDSTHDLTNAAGAFKHMDAGSHFCKVVVKT
jgi:hypothetical protein